MGRAKGTTLLQPVKLLRGNPEAAQAVLPERLHHYLTERILVSNWYPEEDHIALLCAAGQVVGGDPWIQFGQLFADFELGGVHRALVRPGDAVGTLRGFARIWGMNHDTGTVTISIDENNLVAMELAGYCEVSREFCGVAVGYLAGAVRLSSDVKVKVTHPLCTSRHDEKCRWEFKLP